MNELAVLSRTVVCPSCDAYYDMGSESELVDGSVIHCEACGHGWIEGRALVVIEPEEYAGPRPEDEDFLDPDREAERIASAAKVAEEERRIARRKRRASMRGWALLTASLAAGFAAVAMFPEGVVRALPGAARLYERAGIEVNVRGLEIRRVSSQIMTVDGTRVLAVKGEIVNVSGDPRKVPAMRFAVRSGNSAELYAWILASVGNRALKPGEATSFLTRISAPPEGSEDVEIRFAQDGEKTVNAGL
ncbi:MAG: hypothetical protein AB7S41_07660 [Parvibaculaceae bacterium]